MVFAPLKMGNKEEETENTFGIAIYIKLHQIAAPSAKICFAEKISLQKIHTIAIGYS